MDGMKKLDPSPAGYSFIEIFNGFLLIGLVLADIFQFHMIASKES
jgi:hypothetical protein